MMRRRAASRVNGDRWLKFQDRQNRTDRCVRIFVRKEHNSEPTHLRSRTAAMRKMLQLLVL